MSYEYYYNDTPESGKVRNNLVYTSLISEDKTSFVQWYYNDKVYHKNKNEVIDPALMQEKWERELTFLTHMKTHFPDMIPEIEHIDYENRKIYLKIDGVDFWQQCLDADKTYDEILPDWQEQMLEILEAYRSLGIYKFSLHPSSYFIVDGKLKSINYFFCHDANEEPIPLSNFRSYISHDRQAKLEKFFEQYGMSWDSVIPWHKMQIITLENFRSNYPDDFIDKALKVYDQ